MFYARGGLTVGWTFNLSVCLSAVAEADRQGAPEAAHAAMWPGPAPLGLDGRGGD